MGVQTPWLDYDCLSAGSDQMSMIHSLYYQPISIPGFWRTLEQIADINIISSK